MQPFVRAFFSMVLGALAAPAVYVLAGLILPSGFHDLRNASATVWIITFGAAWLFSVVATFGLGAPLWYLLHKYGYDGFLSYLVIAIIGFLTFHFGFRAEGAWEFGAIMALANAAMVRAVELVLKSRGIK